MLDCISTCKARHTISYFIEFSTPIDDLAARSPELKIIPKVPFAKDLLHSPSPVRV